MNLPNLRINSDRLWASLMEMAEIGGTPAGGWSRGFHPPQSSSDGFTMPGSEPARRSPLASIICFGIKWQAGILLATPVAGTSDQFQKQFAQEVAWNGGLHSSGAGTAARSNRRSRAFAARSRGNLCSPTATGAARER